MYKVRCWLVVCGTTDIWLRRDIELPFPPMIGLELSFGDDWTCVVDKLSWDFVTSSFSVWRKRDDWLYQEMLAGRPHEQTVVERAEEWVSVGWVKHSWLEEATNG